MRRYFIVLIIIATYSISTATAQHYLGARIGYGAGTARFTPSEETRLLMGLPSAGISYKFYSETRYVGGIEIDLQYIQKGYKYLLAAKSDTSYQRTIDAIELPLFWQPHVYLFNYKARVFLNLGVNISYNFNSHYKYTNQDGDYDQGKYPFKVTRDNRFGYGLCGGGGIGVLFNRFEVTAEVRYYYGYSDILKNTSKYESNPRRSPVDNLNISLGCYYRLGKGDIRSKNFKPKK